MISVRYRTAAEHTFRAFGPRREDTPGGVCPACGVPFIVGDVTTLVPIGPGDNEEARTKAREGRWYNAVAVEAHYACVTGNDAPEVK